MSARTTDYTNWINGYTRRITPPPPKKLRTVPTVQVNHIKSSDVDDIRSNCRSVIAHMAHIANVRAKEVTTKPPDTHRARNFWSLEVVCDGVVVSDDLQRLKKMVQVIQALVSDGKLICRVDIRRTTHGHSTKRRRAIVNRKMRISARSKGVRKRLGEGGTLCG